MSAGIVFIDIAGPDDQQLHGFYSSLFGWKIAEDGQFTVAASATLSAAIRRDPAEKRIYLGVDDVAAKLREVEAAGGSIDAARFEVPGVVILGLFRDPAGNPRTRRDRRRNTQSSILKCCSGRIAIRIVHYLQTTIQQVLLR